MKQSSGIIVKCQNKVLLCKRAKINEPNKWAIPMGGIEPNENTKDAAYREFSEEMGVSIQEDIKYIGFINRYNKNGEFKSRLHLYSYDTNVKLIPDLENASHGFEHSECGYFSKQEISEMNISDSLKEAVLKSLSD